MAITLLALLSILQLDSSGLYIASFAPGSTEYIPVLIGSSGSSNITSVSLNSFGNAIGGGIYLGNRYAALFNASLPSPIVTEVSFPTGNQ